jgi:2-polyprenyl-6-methoxyphenol hydroxylase-like FAD-dependent oxidoreductase
MPLVNSAGLRILLLWCVAISHNQAMAETVRMLIQSAAVAGFRHHQAPTLFDQLRPGDMLILKREPDNPYDRHAIQVLWQGQLLGYVPRRNNQALAWAMDQNPQLSDPQLSDPQIRDQHNAERNLHRNFQISARISALHARARPRGRIEFDVFLE